MHMALPSQSETLRLKIAVARFKTTLLGKRLDHPLCTGYTQ